MMFYQGKNKLEGNKEEGNGNGNASRAKNNSQWRWEVIELAVYTGKKGLLTFTTLVKLH